MRGGVSTNTDSFQVSYSQVYESLKEKDFFYEKTKLFVSLVFFEMKN